MAERRKRRKWSDEEKCGILAQTKVVGVSVPQLVFEMNDRGPETDNLPPGINSPQTGKAHVPINT